MTDDTKPVAMQFNPAYGTTTKGDTTALSNIGPVAMQSNPAKEDTETKEDNGTKEGTPATANVGPVAMQSNPAYGLTIKGKCMQSESETS